MKTRCYDFIMVLILLFHICLSVSCTNDSDLLTELALSDDSVIETTVVDDRFVIQNNAKVILDVLSNDSFDPDDNVHITAISDPIYGSVELGDDQQTIIYTPQNAPATEMDNDALNTEDSETTDTFTYTTEVNHEDETSSTEIGTVELVIDMSSEEESTSEEEEEEDTTDTEPGEDDDSNSNDTDNASANLLFSSGFEGVRLSAPKDGYQYLSGTDQVTGHSWPMRILGSDFSGIHRVNDGGGNAIANRIEETGGPKGGRTSALFQQVKYDVQVTQTPYQINNIKENPKELYMSYWMKTDDTAVKGIDKWRAIWEYKTDNYASNKDGFRMIAFMATDYEGKPYWLFQGDTSPQTPVWQAKNTSVPLILNEWFKVEYYIKWSNGADGYASMKVNGQLIGEHHGPTTANSDDMNFIMLTQVYGNSHPMHQWVDDIEIWDGLPQRQ